MRVKTNAPRNADGLSVLGKCGEHLKANFKSNITTNPARDLFLLCAKTIQPQMVRSMRRLAFLYKGGSSA